MPLDLGLKHVHHIYNARRRHVKLLNCVMAFMKVGMKGVRERLGEMLCGSSRTRQHPIPSKYSKSRSRPLKKTSK